jgi:hypothetical protein
VSMRHRRRGRPGRRRQHQAIATTALARSEADRALGHQLAACAQPARRMVSIRSTPTPLAMSRRFVPVEDERRSLTGRQYPWGAAPSR